MTCQTCGVPADACPLMAEDLYPCCESENSAPSCPSKPSHDHDDKDSCCCKGSMVEALQLLCSESVSSLVDFDKFFFLTDALAVGSTLAVPGTDSDNIDPPAATLRRFSPCNCALLDVAGTAYPATIGATGVLLRNVDQLSLCALKAVGFQLADAECPEECGDTNFDRAVRAIRRAIRAEGGNTGACGRCGAHCDCDDCCCVDGIVNELSTRNLSRQVTITAGPLVLQGATVLGSIGSVLVLARESTNRIFLVCANAIEAIG